MLATPVDKLELRVYRYMLQSAAADLLPKEKVAKCLRQAVPGTLPELHYRDETGKASYRSLIVCSRVWICPVCSPNIVYKRSANLKSGLGNHPELYPALLTWTYRHNAAMQLDKVLPLFIEARQATRRGEPFKRIQARYGWVHQITGLEVTEDHTVAPEHYGNGWHPHYHELVLFDRQITEDERETLQDWLRVRYLQMLHKRGLNASYEHGLDLRFGKDIVNEYVAKFDRWLDTGWSISDEVTRLHSKVVRTAGGRSPFQLLHDYAFNDDKQAGALFIEYARGFKGRSQLHASKGLWALLGIGDESDEELADDYDPLSTYLMTLELADWRRIVRYGLRAELLQHIEAVQGNVIEVEKWLSAVLAVVDDD